MKKIIISFLVFCFFSVNLFYVANAAIPEPVITSSDNLLRQIIDAARKILEREEPKLAELEAFFEKYERKRIRYLQQMMIVDKLWEDQLIGDAVHAAQLEENHLLFIKLIEEEFVPHVNKWEALTASLKGFRSKIRTATGLLMSRGVIYGVVTGVCEMEVRHLLQFDKIKNILIGFGVDNLDLLLIVKNDLMRKTLRPDPGASYTITDLQNGVMP